MSITMSSNTETPMTNLVGWSLFASFLCAALALPAIADGAAPVFITFMRVVCSVFAGLGLYMAFHRRGWARASALIRSRPLDVLGGLLIFGASMCLMLAVAFGGSQLLG